MSYIGSAWMDEELMAAINQADDDQSAFAIAATAVVDTLRVGLGKLTAEVAGLRRDTDRVANETMEVWANIGQLVAVLAKAHGVDLDTLHDPPEPRPKPMTGGTGEYDELPQWAKDALAEQGITSAPSNPKLEVEADDDLMVANLGGGGFVIGRRDAFGDDSKDA